jgi:Outer membrane protein beta-barrel domain
MKNLFTLVFLIVCLNTFSQEVPNFEAIDSLYREDQFYINVSYNILKNTPASITQNSLSSGIDAGFLRDFPLNKSRTFAIAPGLGFSFNNYIQNLIIEENGNTISYSVIPSNFSYDRNKFGQYFVDLPIEFRWRTSTFDSHKFWRVYLGAKCSYLLYSRSSYVAQGKSFKIDNNADFNKIQYGVYAALGYNSANFYVYYGLQDIFKNGMLNNAPLEMRTLNLGLMFYIL